MKPGQVSLIDFEIFAYPYPGRSANIILAAPRSFVMRKKLMARVRPGVEETFAAFAPTSVFSKLDLPTFDRPRNATSGTLASGNCAADNAERRNWAVTRIARARTSSSVYAARKPRGDMMVLYSGTVLLVRERTIPAGQPRIQMRKPLEFPPRADEVRA